MWEHIGSDGTDWGWGMLLVIMTGEEFVVLVTTDLIGRKQHNEFH